MRTCSCLSILVTIVLFSRYLEISSQRLQIPADIGEHELWWGWKLLSTARRSFGWAKVERRKFIKVKCKIRSNSILCIRCWQIFKNYTAIATAQWNLNLVVWMRVLQAEDLESNAMCFGFVCCFVYTRYLTC